MTSLSLGNVSLAPPLSAFPDHFPANIRSINLTIEEFPANFSEKNLTDDFLKNIRENPVFRSKSRKRIKVKGRTGVPFPSDLARNLPPGSIILDSEGRPIQKVPSSSSGNATFAHLRVRFFLVLVFSTAMTFVYLVADRMGLEILKKKLNRTYEYRTVIEQKNIKRSKKIGQD